MRDMEMQTQYDSSLDMTSDLSFEEIGALAARIRQTVLDVAKAESAKHPERDLLAHAKYVYARTLTEHDLIVLEPDYKKQPWYGFDPMDSRELLDIFDGEYGATIPWMEQFFGRRFLDDPAAFIVACCRHASRPADVGTYSPDVAARADRDFVLLPREEFWLRFGFDTLFFEMYDDCLVRCMQFAGNPHTLMEELESGGEALLERIYHAMLAWHFNDFCYCIDDYAGPTLKLDKLVGGLEWRSMFKRSPRFEYEAGGMFAKEQPEEVLRLFETYKQQFLDAKNAVVKEH